ncbi:MAG: riboflavin kinase / adenylyltransferase [Chloroflexota bacterium]|jgi:riboflavin kinase/FMN adenylyltransferase|nr:riboflavin kinase / adenylyltransferase [Chloroflexota bacterium]
MTGVKRNQPGVFLTIGVFDGVHRGHCNLIDQMVKAAREAGAATAAVTFDPHPDAVLNPELALPAICTMDERIALLRERGIDEVEVLRFTPQVAKEAPEEFVAELLRRYDLRMLWVGPDFALGRDRTGTREILREIGQQRGFEVVSVQPLIQAGRPVSSSWIREALADGNVTLVAELLGRPFCITGDVVAGMRRGREIGFPTANVVPPSGRALPADGVYYVEAQSGGEDRRWPGVVNLGARPTFAESERLLETHLLDFSGDLYGATLAVYFLEKLRGIQRFSGIEELRTQIARDVEAARHLALAAEAGSG